MSSNVVPLDAHPAFEKTETQSVARSLRQARQAKLRDVLVIGYRGDGSLFICGHPNDPRNAMWMMAQAKQLLLNPGDS